MLKGGCFCGAIRYEAEGAPFDQTNCHCSICRRTSGAPFITWFSVRRSGFRWISGEPARLRSSAHATRGFCPRCGTPLTFESERWPDEVGLTVCSLDEPNAVPPRDHIFAGDKVGWLRLCDGLPEFRESR